MMTKQIDYQRVSDLAALMCTQREIAEAIGFTPEGFCRRKKRDPKLVEAIDMGRFRFMENILSAQIKKALEDGDTRMLIHLGKTYLGQNKPINFEVPGYQEDTSKADLSILTDEELDWYQRIRNKLAITEDDVEEITA